MTAFRKCMFTLAALLAAFLTGPAMAQTAPEIIGEWHGNAAVTTGDQCYA